MKKCKECGQICPDSLDYCVNEDTLHGKCFCSKFEQQIDTQPVPGRIYKHYKGGLYEAMYVAKHTTTGEKMVIYKSFTEGTIYARPLNEWFEKVITEGDVETVRFKVFHIK